MLTKAKWRITTNIKITVRDLAGNVLDIVEYHNLITIVGLNLIRDLLEGLEADGEIKVLGIGDDNTVPTTADTILGNEIYRKAITSFSEPGDGQLKTITYVSPAEAVGLIEELGWFAGALANPAWPGGADSGIMISRILYHRNKTNLESIQVERTDSIAEA